ncbi:tRNA pseudouridine(38-40) synthase TruA [Candidatus Margulisiibacteriota bacterium]
MRRFALVVGYLGSPFKGFQVQPQEDTVQKFLEQELAKICDHPIRVIPAGRTDAGVHANEQVVHFETKSKIAANNLLRALNSNLPGEIRVKRAKEILGDFHSRFSALKREYIYNFSFQAPVPLYLKNFVWDLYPSSIDLKAIKKALKVLRGKHDFSQLSAVSDKNKNKSREIYKIALHPCSAQQWLGSRARAKTKIWSIHIEANAYLQKMVRMIAGILIEVGQGKKDSKQLQQVLAGKKIKLPKLTAPAHGLCLNKITYKEKI